MLHPIAATAIILSQLHNHHLHLVAITAIQHITVVSILISILISIPLPIPISVPISTSIPNVTCLSMFQSMSSYDGLLKSLREELERANPVDPLRYLRTALDSRIEQRQQRALSSADATELPRPHFQVESRSQRQYTLFGLDVGGSLCKVAFYEGPENRDAEVPLPSPSSPPLPSPGRVFSRFCFSFSSHSISLTQCVDGVCKFE